MARPWENYPIPAIMDGVAGACRGGVGFALIFGGGAVAGFAASSASIGGHRGPRSAPEDRDRDQEGEARCDN